MSGCVVCQKPLEVEIEADSDDEYEQQAGGGPSSSKAPAPATETVPDDVQLTCGCHFHWDCLLSSYEIASCPSCARDIVSCGPSGAQQQQQQVLCSYHNEGGLQTELDILPLLTEESYLKAYPEDRKARAFLEFCREGDFKAVVDMLMDDDVEEDDEDDDNDEDVQMGSTSTDDPARDVGIDKLLRYQDPIGNMQSGLHAAVQAQSREVAWLLLLLASNLNLLEFPAQVFQEAEALGIMRGLTEDKVDIRSLRDADGKTAEDLAREVGGVWIGWTGNQRLAI